MTPGHGLAILRILMGVFFLFQGIGKLPWLLAPGLLMQRLTGYSQVATPLNQWYLDLVMPWASVFARLVALGELAAGVALIAGVWTRPAAAVAVLMVMNFHLASGALFTFDFLTDGYALPVVGSLIALVLSGKRLPWSLRA